jgi:hypothetical protein
MPSLYRSGFRRLIRRVVWFSLYKVVSRSSNQFWQDADTGLAEEKYYSRVLFDGSTEPAPRRFGYAASIEILGYRFATLLFICKDGG